MGLYASLTDLLRQVANVLQPEHGGTGSTYGEKRVVIEAFNRTGGDLPLYTLVQWANVISRRIDAVSSLDSTDVLGVVVGYYDLDGVLVEADAPDTSTVAVQTVGTAKILIESTVTAGEYAFAAATDGTIYSSSTLATGAFGVVMQNGDTGQGITEIEVQFPLLNASAGGGGGSFGTPALTLSTSNAAGAASTGIRTDATVAVFDATAPVTQAFGDSAATGSAGKAARRDHKHGMPSSPSVPAQGTPGLTLGTSNVAGSSGAYVGTDATVAAFDATAPVTQAFGDSAATGSAGVAARRDHKHGMPSESAETLPVTIIGAKGDLIVGTADDVADRLGVGTDGYVLVSDSAQTKGIKWAAVGGSSVASWTKDLDEDGSSFANWTGGSGSWSSNGTIIQQTNTSITQRNGIYNNKLNNGTRAVQLEVRGITAGFFAGIFFFDGGATSTAGWQLGVDDTANSFKSGQPGGAGNPSIAVTGGITTNTWYKISVLKVGDWIHYWVDGVEYQTVHYVGGTQDIDSFALIAFGACDFRNIKSWSFDPFVAGIPFTP